jgi:hypothetical protein
MLLSINDLLQPSGIWKKDMIRYDKNKNKIR